MMRITAGDVTAGMDVWIPGTDEAPQGRWRRVTAAQRHAGRVVFTFAAAYRAAGQATAPAGHLMAARVTADRRPP